MLKLCPTEWAGWSHWSTCSQSCGLGTRGRTRICSHSKSGTTGTISLVSDEITAGELINPDNFVEENEESEDYFSINSSGDSASRTEIVEDLMGRISEDGELQDPSGSCIGEKAQMEDCREIKCPGLGLLCDFPNILILICPSS